MRPQLAIGALAAKTLDVEALLRREIEGFPQNPGKAAKTLRELSESRWEHFFASALLVLRNAADGPGIRYLVTLLMARDALIDPLCDPAVFTLEEALLLARHMAAADPLLDSRLAKRLVELADRIPPGDEGKAADRLLTIIGAISDGTRILPLLAQLLKHGNSRVRSKAALLLSRSSSNVTWARSLMSEDDPRVRANAIEALWSVGSEPCRSIFSEAVADINNRVASNALMGLYRSGDTASIEQILRMAIHPDANFRASAAWVMGETEDPRFAPALSTMMRDGEALVRKNVFRAVTHLRQKTERRAIGPRLRVWLSPSRSTADCSRRLSASIRSAEGNFVSGLTPMEFILWEDNRPVPFYTVAVGQRPRELVLGFALPRSGGEWEKVIVDALPKSGGDRWAVLKYGEQPAAERHGGGAAKQHKLFGVRLGFGSPASEVAPAEPVRFLMDTPSFIAALTSPGSRSAAAHGVLEAVRLLLSAGSTQAGERHLMVIDPWGAAGSEAELAEIAASAQAAHFSISGVGPRMCGLARLCELSGGTFLATGGAAEVPQMVERLCALFAGRYDLTYTSQAAVGAEPALKLQVCAKAGFGEACVEG